MTFPLCTSILFIDEEKDGAAQGKVSHIANPRVFHSAIHTGSDSAKEFGLRIFQKSFLQ